MADRIRAAKRGPVKNGNGVSTSNRAASRPGTAPGATSRLKTASRRATAAHHEVEETFGRGYWRAWGRPALEGAALCFALVAAIAWMRPREPAAALELAGSPDYELGFSPDARRLAPDIPARAALDLEVPAAAAKTSAPAGEPTVLETGIQSTAVEPPALASAKPAIHSPRPSGAARSVAAAPAAVDRRGGAEPGKKRRTSVEVEKRVEKVEVITRPPIIQKPRVRYAPKPTFPAAARADEKEGFVRFRVQISPTGSVEDVEILEADPPGVFDETVKTAVRLWQFAPARDEAGKGVSSSYENTIAFEVEQAGS